MLLLVLCSAFFSGAETAYFNLSRRQVKLMQESAHKVQNLAASLLRKPGRLLSCLLFGNMIVNVLFYAAASVLTARAAQRVGAAAAVVTAAGAFCVLVLFGEILPKSLAYANSKRLSVATALPVTFCLKVFMPIIFVFRLIIVEPVLRLLLGQAKRPGSITTSEFKALIEHIRKRGLITAEENRLLAEVAEFGFLKVRDCLRPRVDMVVCELGSSHRDAVEKMQKNRLTKLPVYAKKIDNIVGLVHLRRLLLEPDKPLSSLVEAVHFVPEQKTIESLLEFFRETHTDTAIVVDEYGGIAGSICLEDVAEELLGPIEIGSGIKPIEQTGPFRYRLAGNLAVHEWAAAFGINTCEMRISTIGGLVTALLGRIPKPGDTASLKNLQFTVEAVRKHRIESLVLTLESNQPNG